MHKWAYYAGCCFAAERKYCKKKGRKKNMKKRNVASKSITNIFYLWCLLFNAIILLICVVSFLLYSRENIVSTLDDVLTSNAATVSQQFDTLLNNADNVLKEIQTNKSLLNISKELNESGRNYFDNNIVEREQFLSVFRYAMVSWGTRGSICFYSNAYDNVGYATDAGKVPTISAEKIEAQTIIPQILQTIKYVDYIPPHTDYNDSEKSVFSVVRAMRDPYNTYGILVYNYDISTISQLLDGLELLGNYELSIFDAENTMVYSTAEEALAQQIAYSYENRATVGEPTFRTSEESNSCVQSRVAGWKLVLTTNNDQYMQSVRKLIITVILLFGTIFVIMSAFLKMLIRQLTLPLRELVKQLTRLKEGENINLTSFPQSSEVALLSNTIQKNLRMIILQNQRLTEATAKTLQAQYHAMEAQLNPHMLYNTLSVIGMAALNDGSVRTADMCGDLAELLRYSVAYTGQNVCMDKEIENIRTYMKIMKARYEEDFVFEIHADAGIEQIVVPKLMLQPIVENCFKHGFQQTEPPWRISVTATICDGKWLVSIENNGKEFDPLALIRIKGLLRQLRDDEYPLNNELSYGHGLESTIYRLYVHERGNAYVNISSAMEKTCIKIGGSVMAQKETE